MIRKLLFMLPIAALCMFGACEKDGPIEEAGENIDEGVEEVTDEMKDAADEVEDQMD